MRSFKNWCITEGKDIFGFDKDIRPEKKDMTDVNPIDFFDIEKITHNLAMHNVGELLPEVQFVSEVTWGDGNGSMRVRINTWLNVIIERKTIDLTGKEQWIAKKIYQLNHKQYGGMEDAVAHEILQEVENVYKRRLDSPSKEYKEFQTLVSSVASAIRRNAHDIFIFNGIKRINENNYIIRLALRGHGVQRKGQKRVEENHTQMTYDQEAGLIRLTNYNIESSLAQHEWAVTQSDIDWYFAPTQEKEEIAQTISTTLHWY